jgi:trimethylamine--corrinoid protein Co-methyltransferase
MIQPISNPRLSLNILSDADVLRIHTATLDLIESTGIRFPSQRALDILAAHGAQVDRAAQVARIPGPLVEQALQLAPPVYVLAGRDPLFMDGEPRSGSPSMNNDLILDGSHVYLGTDGCGVEVIDAFSGQRRASTKADAADCARLADALDEIGFWWSMVSAQDCPPASRGLHELEAAWNNTSKHLQTESIVSAAEMQAAVRMAEAVAGGRAELRRRPPLSIMQCTVSPLGHDAGSLEAGLVAAEAGLPVGYMTMASCASSAPATLAGALLVGNAEVVSALALMQMAAPGAPVYYAAAQTAMDLRTGGYTGGGPEDYLFGAATNRLADFYNLPLSMGAFATGAKQPGWQAAVDNSFSSFMASLTGSDMLLGCGLLHGSRILSYAQMVMDCEIYSIVRKMMEGIDVNEETLALDVIRAAGPGGNFLTQKHTRAHMRQLWRPRLFDRRSYDAWEADPTGPADWALQRARELLQSHQPAPLEPGLAAELKRIIASVE